MQHFKRLDKSQIRYFKELATKKYRRKYQRFLVEGLRLGKELLQSEYTVERLVVAESFFDSPHSSEIIEAASRKSVEILHTDQHTLTRLGTTCNPQPLIASAVCHGHRLQDEFFDQGSRYLVLLDVTDPGNVGTLLRSAEAFGWNGVICAGQTVEIYNPKVLRASMGAAFRLKVVCSNVETLMSFFEYTGVPYITTLPIKGMKPPFGKLPERFALLLGSEAHGLPQNICSGAYAAVRLPMNQPVESLNVAVAGSIFLFLLQNSS